MPAGEVATWAIRSSNGGSSRRVRGRYRVRASRAYRNTLHLRVVAAAHPILRAMTPTDHSTTRPRAWDDVPERLRARGLRWTPQRRILVEVLSQTDGHVTGAELVDRCRAVDPGTIPSTVYRTLDVLEELGVVSHSHGADGREEFHVLPDDRARPPVLPALRQRGGPGRRRPGRRSPRSRRSPPSATSRSTCRT